MAAEILNYPPMISKRTVPNALVGITLVALSAILFGVTPVFAHMTRVSGASSSTVLFYRFLIASAILIFICILQKRKFPRGKQLAGLLVMGGIAYFGMSFSYFSALELISASLVVLLLYLYPALVMLISGALHLEKLGRYHLLALGLALGGVVLIAGADLSGSISGILYGLSSALLYALYIVAGFFFMKGIDPLPGVAVVMSSTTVAYALWNVFAGYTPPTSLSGWVGVLALAVGSTVLSSTLFFSGMKIVGPTVSSMVSTLEPVTAMFLGVLLLGETMTLTKVIGGFLILAASIFLALLKWKEPEIQVTAS